MISVNQEVPYRTVQHKRLVREIRARKTFSERKLSHRYKQWRESDEQQQLYIKESEADRIAKASKSGSGVIDYVQVEIPYSFGMMMTQHTYFASVFLGGRSPIHQYTGRHGEGEDKVLAVESLIDYQVNVGKNILPYYIWLYDACKYGVGILGEYWVEEQHHVSVIKEEDELYLGRPSGKKQKIKTSETVDGYHGHKFFNVRPDKFFHDPRVTYANLQKGEYCGRETSIPWTEIKTGALQGQYFNIEELEKSLTSRETGFNDNRSSQMVYPEPQDVIFEGDSKDKGFVKIWEFYVKIIPKEWKLGKGEYPEIWIFTVANETILIECRPYSCYCNEYPYSAIEQEIDGYMLYKRGVMEQGKPLNDIITWLFNTHFFNVRSALNNQFIYDPRAISLKDVMDPGPGKRIAMKPEFAGQDIRKFFQQLPVSDVTRSHISDQDMVGSMMQRMSGIVDNMQGLVNDGGRKTATEVRRAGDAGIGRQRILAEYISAMGFMPHSQRILQNTQQFYELERKYKIAGDTATGTEFMDITPASIAGFFDFVPVDGTLPVDRFAQANLWKEILLGVNQMPQIAMQYDLAKIFSWMSQLSGLKNIKRFRINIQQPGMNPMGGGVVPMNQLNNLNEPAQLPNMGPTG